MASFEPKDRNVYILGAGFSRPAGAPLVKEFLDAARSLYDDPQSGLGADVEGHFRRVFEFKRAMAPVRERFLFDLDNVEELFGLIEISNRLGKNGAPRREMIELIAETLRISVSQFAEQRTKARFQIPKHLSADFKKPAFAHDAQPNGGNTVHIDCDLHSYFVGLVGGLLDDPDKRKNRKDTIITLNYDLVCDEALRHAGFKVNYHLQDAANTDTFDSISLLKLHGSVNWRFCPRCEQARVVNNAQIDTECRNCEPAPQPELLLVPPSWDKAEYQTPIKSVWLRAVEELKSASRICVIGYSMAKSDAFFRYLLTLALAENEHLFKLVVVDPDKAIESRYREEFDHLFLDRRFQFGTRNQAQDLARFLSDPESRRLLGRGEVLAGFNIHMQRVDKSGQVFTVQEPVEWA